MCILVVLNALVHVDMGLKVLVSGMMAMEIVVVVDGRMILEGFVGEICCFGTVRVLKRLNFLCCLVGAGGVGNSGALLTGFRFGCT